MANEINITGSLSISKNGQTITASKNITNTLAGNVFTGTVQTIGTTREAITVPGDFTLNGYMMITNNDATNFVTITISDAAPGVATTIAKLLPGEFCIWKPQASAAPYALADTANCDISVVWTEL